MPAPTSWSASSSVSYSGNAFIDALVGGSKWGGATGTGTTITFSFPGADSFWSTNSSVGYGPTHGNGEPWSFDFSPLSSSDRTNFTAALQEWANVAKIKFTQVSDTSTNVGDIRVAYTYTAGDDGSEAWAYLPGRAAYSGDVWFNAYGVGAFEVWAPGSYSFQTALHEQGHALGLKHPFSGARILPHEYDSMTYTIMSYSALPGDENTYFNFYPTTPMVIDIAAIQYMYGANTSFNSGNTAYSYGSNLYHETIWDGGGIDTLQYSGSLDSAIDLRAGYGSTIGLPVYVQTVSGENILQINNVWIAQNVVIENANGGSGNDLITGNQVANTLKGNGGNDRLDGGAGNDNMAGGTGNDTYIVNAAGDVVTELASQGTDTVRSGVTRILGANQEYLVLTGSTAINGTGNTANNKLTGNAAANTLDGGAGNDTLTGGAGNDTYLTDSTGDVVTESTSAGTDTIKSLVTISALAANVENLTLMGTAAINGTGNGLSNVITGNAAANKLNGGSGNDTLNGEAGNDHLTGGAGNDKLNGGTGNDTFIWDAADSLVDGGAGQDTLMCAGIDLTLIANTRIKNIESINMTDTASSRLTLNLSDLLDISSTTNTLQVIGNAGDSVDIVGAFTVGAVSGGFRSYAVGGGILMVETELSVV